MIGNLKDEVYVIGVVIGSIKFFYGVLCRMMVDVFDIDGMNVFDYFGVVVRLLVENFMLV